MQHSVTAANRGQSPDKRRARPQAQLNKYPESFRLDVYKTHRPAAAPHWVYDNTVKNATRASLLDSPAGPVPEGAYAGIP